MNPKVAYAIIGFLIVAMGSLVYHQHTLHERVAELQLQLDSATPDGRARSMSPIPDPSLIPNSKSADSFDPFFRDSFTWDTDPRDTMKRMQERMEKLLENPLGSQNPFDPQFPFAGFPDTFLGNPNIKIEEKKDYYLVVVSPIDAESHNIDVRIKNQQLTLTFETKVATEEKSDSEKGSRSRYSSSSQQFTKSVTLGEPVDESSIKTSFDKDVLTITIDKKI